MIDPARVSPEDVAHSEIDGKLRDVIAASRKLRDKPGRYGARYLSLVATKLEESLLWLHAGPLLP